MNSPHEIKSSAVRYYSSFFSSKTLTRPQISGINFERLNSDQAAHIERIICDQEIYQALEECSGDKTPGPDGFSIRFIRNSWEFMGKEICSLIRKFFDSGSMTKGINSSFLTLIPKKDKATIWSEFRLISLVGCIYKIISKIMANRLGEVITYVVSENQHGFLKDRQTLDCILIANEVVSFLKERKVPGVLFKLDVEKAYDSIEWSFFIGRHAEYGVPGLVEEMGPRVH